MTSTLHAQSVISDQDSRVDFSKFKTYAWLAPGDSVLNRYRSDKLFGGYIMHFANAELKKLGLQQDTIKPDAIFVFYTSVEEITTYSQTATLSVGVGVGGPGYYVGAAAPVAGGDIITSTEGDGSLKFSMYDTQTGNQVWWGMAERTFKMSDDIENILADYTARIFRKFPKVKKKK
jgi:hypothetical protein